MRKKEKGSCKARPPQGKKVGVPEHLTAREEEIAELIGAGHTEGGMAELLGISVHTVRKHRSSGRKKLGAETAAHFAVMYERIKVARQSTT